MSYLTNYSPKEVAKGLIKLIRSGEIEFDHFSKNYKPTDRRALDELRSKEFIMENGGHFFFGGIDVTVSEYCFCYHNKRCPPRSGDEWGNCYKHNTPCGKFIYFPWNGANR